VSFGAWFLRRGRISRRSWWLHYFLPVWGLLLLAGVADGALGYPGLSAGAGDPTAAYAHTGGPLELLISIVMTVPAISGTVARMHDRGLSARWLWW